MRERGSSTARPTEKGGGGLTIGARPVDFGASFRADSVGFGAISSRFADFLLSIRADTQADTQETPKLTRRKHKKSPIPQSGNRASGVARRRALLTFC